MTFNLIAQINEELNQETAHKQWVFETLLKIYGDDHSTVFAKDIEWKLCEAIDGDNAGSRRAAEAEWVQQHAKDKQSNPERANQLIKDPRLQHAGMTDTSKQAPQKGDYVRFADITGLIVDVDIQHKKVMIKASGKETVQPMEKLVNPSILPLKTGGKARVWKFIP